MPLLDDPDQRLPVCRVLCDWLAEVVVHPDHLVNGQVEVVRGDGAGHRLAAGLDSLHSVRCGGVLQYDP